MKKISKLFSLLLLAMSVSAGADTPPETKETGDPDGGWPRAVSSAAGSEITVYQPQIEDWIDQKSIVAWAAVEILVSGKPKSALGVVKWEGQTSVAIDSRLVRFTNLHIKEVNFPSLYQPEIADATAAMNKIFPADGFVLALDRVLAAIDKSAIRSTSIKINPAPPPIFYSSKPAFLVQFDGEPIISPIKDSTLKYVVNTNWDVLQDPETALFYLRLDKNWVSAPAVDKEWVPVKKLPKSFSTIPADENWTDVRASIPAKSLSKSNMPIFFVSKLPAELIVTKGKPKLKRIEKSKLYWIENTECDLFQMKKGQYYFLVSGRWFRAEKLEGPWTFATADLPPEFLSFPSTHPRARIRSSIPGTDEATEAVLLAQIPQTLRVSRKDLQLPEVKYQGEPEFKEIKEAKVSYAVNCSNDVLKVRDMYYLCFQGAWFQSSQAKGPWELTTSVPDEIYKIPADCPVHHVTYVRVDSSDPESVTYACTSGYSGVTVSFGVAMWGAGWYYPPYYYHGGYYPVYYPYHSSYGSYAIYNSRTGAYGYGSTVSGPYGGISRAATYNPNTGTYARGTAAWGPSGAKAHGQAYNPRTGTSLETTQNRNRQGSWGSTKVQRGDDWAQSGHVKTDQGKVSGVRTSEGDGAIRAKGENGSGFVGKKGDDIYAGKDGNVYRKTEDGWQQHGEGGWSDVDRGQPKASTQDRPGGNQPVAGTRDQLNRDAGARVTGNDRTRDYSRQSSANRSGASQRGGSGRSGGSYGGGGGRSGGGGGRRR